MFLPTLIKQQPRREQFADQYWRDACTGYVHYSFLPTSTAAAAAPAGAAAATTAAAAARAATSSAALIQWQWERLYVSARPCVPTVAAAQSYPAEEVTAAATAAY